MFGVRRSGSLVAFVVAAAVTLFVGASSADEYNLGPGADDLFLAANAPTDSFDKTTPPPAPDYSKPDAWLVWPGRPSDADLVPPGEKNNQASAPVDVFYIYPTTFLLSFGKWNAHYDQAGAVGAGLNGVVRGQITAFNGCCRIFAPRYRQAALYTFIVGGDSSMQAFDLAYQDIRNAFNYYLAHENHGRPFIIASHSQGSLHAERLVQEIKGLKLFKRMVAAYTIGSSLPEDIEKMGIPICDVPDQTGCILNYNSIAEGADNSRRAEMAPMFLDGKYMKSGGHPIVCVNPLTWRRDDKADASQNLGSLTSIKGDTLPPLVKGAVGGACVNHALVISITPGTPGFSNQLVKKTGDYHIYDYGLFWDDIRQNAQTRIDAYLKKATQQNGMAATPPAGQPN